MDTLMLRCTLTKTELGNLGHSVSGQTNDGLLSIDPLILPEPPTPMTVDLHSPPNGAHTHNHSDACLLMRPHYRLGCPRPYSYAAPTKHSPSAGAGGAAAAVHPDFTMYSRASLPCSLAHPALGIASRIAVAMRTLIIWRRHLETSNANAHVTLTGLEIC
jgi:hypothetical protein